MGAYGPICAPPTRRDDARYRRVEHKVSEAARPAGRRVPVGFPCALTFDSSTAIGDFENPLPKKLTRRLAAFASSWWDMRHAAQIMFSRSELGKNPADYFARRGLLDGAVITYARCFADGTRTKIADIRAVHAGLDEADLKTHETAIWWRNKHVGHRVDATLEQVDVTLLWCNWRQNAPTIRTRVVSTIRPETASFEEAFQGLAEKLASRIWQQFLHPVQQEVLAEIGPARLAQLQVSATPFHETPLQQARSD